MTCASYLYAGGLRLGGFDSGTTAGNTIYNGNNSLCITTNTGYNINFGQLGGQAMFQRQIIMVLHVFQHYVHKKSKLSVSYIQPNPQDEIRNTTPITNLPRINFCAGAYTTGNAIEPYLTVYCADSYNGFNTIVILNCVGGAYSGYS